MLHLMEKIQYLTYSYSNTALVQTGGLYKLRKSITRETKFSRIDNTHFKYIKFINVL